MATPIKRFVPNGANTCNITPCGDCLVGYCCCPQPPYCTPSSVPLEESMLITQPNFFNQEHHTSYEYKEPEENFVSIDDIKIKKFLTKIGQQKQTFHEHSVAQNQCKKHRSTKKTTIFSMENESSMRPVVYEIIELDDEEERKKLKRIKLQAEKDNSKRISDSNYAKRQAKCLDISLIPKYSNKYSNVVSHVEDCSTSKSLLRSSNPTIVAEIDLIDSSNSDSSLSNIDDCLLDKFHQEDEELVPLAASVQCELLCDDNSGDSHKSGTIYKEGKHLKKCAKKKHLKSDYTTEFQQVNSPICWGEDSGRRERVLFECFLCGKKVQSSYNLRRHMMIHTGEKPFNCDLCNRQFREFSDLKKHRRRHAGEVKFLCMICGKFPPADNDPTRCVNCCAQTKSSVIVAASASRLSHSSAITISKQNEKFAEVDCKNEKKTPVPEARFQFPEKSLVNIIKSSSEIQKEQHMNKLEISQLNSLQRAQHLLNNLPAVHRPNFNQLGSTTRKEFPCPLCSRVFGSRHNLKRHYMIHTGEKPFSCTECRKPFREYSTLKKHMVTHQRDRWYKCVRCSQKFRDFLQYCEHKKLHPINIKDSSDISNFKRCTFTSDSKYDDSSSDDWLECFECAQSFTTVESYNNHTKQHDLNIRSYECYICKKQFNDEGDLQIHKELHNHEQGFS